MTDARHVPVDATALMAALWTPEAAAARAALRAAAWAPYDEGLGPVVQYVVADPTLALSAPKFAVQLGHAVSLALGDLLDAPRDPTAPPRVIDVWLRQAPHVMKKIVLRGRPVDLDRLAAAGAYVVRDLGLTEVAPGTRTLVALPPLPRAVAAPFVKRLQIYGG